MDKHRMIRNLAWPAALVAMLVLSSCNAPGDSAAVATANSESRASPAVPTLPSSPPTADPKAAPAPPILEPKPKPEDAPVLPSTSLGADKGRACRIDADCAMKDAGSCCGYRPVCVNKDTPTFPEKVKTACANEGRVGICGFQAIDGCQCVAGKCEGALVMENSVPLQ